jgi:hypothetical protein
MKNIMDQRIRRIEDFLQSESVTCMIAVKTEQGIKWNGVTYPDEKALDKALKEILGEYQRVPLVILDKSQLSGQIAVIDSRGNCEK